MIYLKIKKEIIKKDNLILSGLEVELKGTTLLILEGYGAFFMCGALDVDIYNSLKMKDRKVICGKALGVKTLDELYNGKIEKISNHAKECGLVEGMKVYEAFKRLSEK